MSPRRAQGRAPRATPDTATTFILDRLVGQLATFCAASAPSDVVQALVAERDAPHLVPRLRLIESVLRAKEHSEPVAAFLRQRSPAPVTAP